MTLYPICGILQSSKGNKPKRKTAKDDAGVVKIAASVRFLAIALKMPELIWNY